MHMRDEIFSQPEVLKRCLCENKQKAMELAGNLGQISQIIIVARGSSDNAGTYGRYLFEIVTGIPVSMAACSVITAYKKDMHYKNTLVIGLSQSGAAQDVCEVLKVAQDSGAVTAAITNDPASPVARQAAYHFCLCAGEEKSVAATKTVSAQMLILALIAGYMSKNIQLLSAIESVPQDIKKILSLQSVIKDAASKFQFAESCTVLSRGLCYMTALEAALKLQETSYTNARGMSIADFAHGPLAMIEVNTPVIVFVPSDETRQSVIELTEQIGAFGANLLLFAQEETGLPVQTVLLPKTSSFTTPIAYLAAAQMFACELAQLRGINPDSPRNIKKVTITR